MTEIDLMKIGKFPTNRPFAREGLSAGGGLKETSAVCQRTGLELRFRLGFVPDFIVEPAFFRR